MKVRSNMDDEEYTIPLQDQWVFGAGIKRKRVQFVPSTSSTSTATTLATPSVKSSRSIGDIYLSRVLSTTPELESNTSTPTTLETTPEAASTVCEVCNLPLSETGDNSSLKLESRPHEASLAHQVCLTHSHPPSHLDRKRKGLSYLSAYGWDPDSRQGLGASGQGIQFPIKPKSKNCKNDKLGLGLVVPKKDLEKFKKQGRVEKLDAGKLKKLEVQEKRKAERLREMFYQNDDVQRYLAGG